MDVRPHVTSSKVTTFSLRSTVKSHMSQPPCHPDCEYMVYATRPHTSSIHDVIWCSNNQVMRKDNHDNLLRVVDDRAIWALVSL